MKSTKETVAALSLPKGKDDHFEPDPSLPGFGVRLRKRKGGGGISKKWAVLHRFNGDQRRKSFGDTRKITLEDARKIARQQFAQVELGIDPDAARAEARAQAAAAKLTLAVAIDRYLGAKQDVLRKSTYKAAKRYFEVHWKPLRDKPLDSIKRADVASRLQELIKAHGRTSAARARDYLRAMFTWAMK